MYIYIYIYIYNGRIPANGTNWPVVSVSWNPDPYRCSIKRHRSSTDWHLLTPTKPLISNKTSPMHRQARMLYHI